MCARRAQQSEARQQVSDFRRKDTFARKSVRNARINYKTPEFELIARGYKHINSSVDRKQPVTTPLLLEVYRQLQSQADQTEGETDLLWGSIVLAFFFLDRSSELWGPITKNDLNGGTSHCVKAADVVLCDRFGRSTEPGSGDMTSVEIIYRSHKKDPTRQGNTIRHYRSGLPGLCPVEAAELCLLVRRRRLNQGKQLGSFLTSVSRAKTINKTTAANAIKKAAKASGAGPKEYSTHSLRIGGACALLAARKSELVIKLMGRWSSWCFTVYTRLRPGMPKAVAQHMIRAATWECPDLFDVPQEVSEAKLH